MFRAVFYRSCCKIAASLVYLYLYRRGPQKVCRTLNLKTNGPWFLHDKPAMTFQRFLSTWPRDSSRTSFMKFISGIFSPFFTLEMLKKTSLWWKVGYFLCPLRDLTLYLGNWMLEILILDKLSFQLSLKFDVQLSTQICRKKTVLSSQVFMLWTNISKTTTPTFQWSTPLGFPGRFNA